MNNWWLEYEFGLKFILWKYNISHVNGWLRYDFPTTEAVLYTAPYIVCRSPADSDGLLQTPSSDVIS